MEVGGQLHDPTASFPWKKQPVPIGFYIYYVWYILLTEIAKKEKL
jgi:hypothetical protein